MSEWNMVVGKREDLLEEIRKIFASPEAIAEIRMARETFELFEGSHLAETALTGRVRVELILHEK